MDEKKVLEDIQTVFEVEMDTPEDARILYNSLYPEISFESNDRSKTSLHLKDSSIIITINSKDIVSLRASINSYIRWIKLSEEILKI